MTEIDAYLRNIHGILQPVTLLQDADGGICDGLGCPLTPTEEITELRGWGSDDGPARVYRNDGGRELLLPRRQSPP